MTSRPFSILSCLLLIFVVSCGSPDKKESSEKKETPPVENAVAEPTDKTPTAHHPYDSDWGYEKNNGPDQWGHISDDYLLCSKGKLQSPIDLKWSKPQTNTRKLEFDYKEVPLQISDNGHTISVKFPPGSKGYFSGKQYELVNLHFHTSSEHTLSGNQLPMEAHLVHKNELGQIAVVAIFMIEGRANSFIEKIWANAPTKHSERIVPNIMVSAEEILPDKMTYYFYVGSLTTPPCTEGVRWQVLNTPVEISREQIIQFRKIYPNNSRPIQPHNARNIINY